MKPKTKTRLLPSITALVVGIACAPAFAADPIKLGLIEDISGDLATYGMRSTKRAASWAVRYR
jgi:hypothetical protein